MLFVLGVGLVVALLRGGKLRNLSELHLRAGWLLFVGFGLQIGAEFVPDDESWSGTLSIGLILASYIALLLVAWINRALRGMWLAGLGVAMNFTVILLNGGMPVSREASILAGGSGNLALDAKHTLLTTESVLPFLADIIPVPGSVISLGDVLLAIGFAVYLSYELRQGPTLFRHKITGEPGSARRT